MMTPAVLRIFSGLHLGAEIELIEGVYVVGTDDSCDLILNDSSLKGRHAALRVFADGGVLRLTVEALDGPVFLRGVRAEEENPVEPLTPFQIGLLTAAWLPDDMPDHASAWLDVDRQLKEEAAPRPEAPSAQPAAMLEQAGALPAEDMNALAMPDAEPQEDEPARKPRRVRDLGIIASMLLVGALCFGWSQSPTELTPAQTMRRLLDEAGYDKLAITENGRSVTVTGRIASDRERGRLLRLAQLLDFPVYLDVAVHSDAADAVRASFNTLGLWPEVTELPPSARPGVRVRGYIRNGYLEELALSNARRNVPALRPQQENGRPALEIFSDICHEDDVQAVLDPALAAAGVDFVARNYLPGKVELRGTLTPQSKAALEEAVMLVLRKLGRPVPFHIVNEAEEQKPQANIYTRHGEQAAQSEAPARFKVVSVSMGAMKFVTLESGEIVFEGGELPGGSILEAISVDALTLSRNGKKTQYPLKSAHE
ncbi:MAG: type III secretion system inner membrane ring subunit SctD [Mailhella sp.]|nr:type III secretion system inner membrane ring subunit SctD [Mailhella sp.]